MEGAREIDSKGMNVPGLDFQCLTTRDNVVEANWVSGRLHVILSSSNIDSIMLSTLSWWGRHECARHPLLPPGSDSKEE